MSKITLISNRNYSVKKFRMGLIKALLKEGYDVSLIIIEDSDERLNIDNVDLYYINENNRSINPFNKLRLQKQIEEILNNIKPDKVFTFQLSPNIFGAIAAHNCGINNIFSMVEGAGDVFIYNTFKWKIIRFFTCVLLKESFKNCNKVFFLNNDDKNEFIDRKLVKQEQCIVIPGIGVDTDYFAYKPITNTNTFLMVARMMPAKGVLEYCEAARIVKKTHSEAVFNYVGEEFTLTKKDIQEYIDDGSINYFGWIEDVRPYYENCFVSSSSSSYREGMPMTLLEAASTGRAIIASNNIGTKEIVKDCYNGFLTKPHNPKDLAEKMIYALENVEKMKTFGKNARNYAVTNFDYRKINKQILAIIKEEK